MECFFFVFLLFIIVQYERKLFSAFELTRLLLLGVSITTTPFVLLGFTGKKGRIYWKAKRTTPSVHPCTLKETKQKKNNWYLFFYFSKRQIFLLGANRNTESVPGGNTAKNKKVLWEEWRCEWMWLSCKHAILNRIRSLTSKLL